MELLIFQSRNGLAIDGIVFKFQYGATNITIEESLYEEARNYLNSNMELLICRMAWRTIHNRSYLNSNMELLIYFDSIPRKVNFSKFKFQYGATNI